MCVLHNPVGFVLPYTLTGYEPHACFLRAGPSHTGAYENNNETWRNHKRGLFFGTFHSVTSPACNIYRMSVLSTPRDCYIEGTPTAVRHNSLLYVLFKSQHGTGPYRPRNLRSVTIFFLLAFNSRPQFLVLSPRRRHGSMVFQPLHSKCTQQ